MSECYKAFEAWFEQQDPDAVDYSEDTFKAGWNAAIYYMMGKLEIVEE